MTTNQVLRQIFEDSGLTKTEFSIQCDTEPSRISCWLNDKENIKFSTLQRLCESYGIKVSITFEAVH